ncbi:MAG: serine/threonine-protein kinase [Myxococcaceae bacterium]
MAETLGRYRLLRLLATGGMGEVFLARQEGPAGFTKTVVIKRILRHLATDQNFIDLFLNEARLAAQLQHPHIAQVFGLENEGNTWFIAMEYVHGRSLRDVIGTAKSKGLMIPPRIAARLASQALQGLHFAHELTDEKGRPLGILHRDVSPENLLVSFGGVVKLVDFGIARAVSGAGARVGRPRGKLSYMAPELTVPGAIIDRRVDVYGLGVVLAEALTLEKPFDVPRLEVAQAPREGWVPRESIPRGLNDVLVRALSPQADARFATAAAMSDALEAWLVSSSQTVVPGDIVGFLEALYGPAVMDVNAGVALGDGAPAITNVLSPRAPGGTQPLSLPSLQPVRVPTEAPPATPADDRRQLVLSITVGTVTALLIGFLLLLALWPRNQVVTVPPAVALLDAGAHEPVAVVLPTLVEYADDAGAEDPPPRPPKPDKPDKPNVKPPVVAKKPQRGKVAVRVNPYAEVFFGGKSLGTTPFAPVEVPAGNATFVLKNSQLGVTRKVTVKVPAGGSVVLKADLFKK